MRKIFLFFVLFCFALSPEAQPSVFEIKNPDFQKSPLTGVTRQHWKDAALYMLEGAFGYIKSLDDPMQFPKMHDITYPRSLSQVPTEKLEGLSRTLFVAAPLLRENPELMIHGIKVADYYRRQISNLVDPTHPSYIKHRAKNGGPSQNLVEYGALAISLFTAPDVLWSPLPQPTKDALARSMLSYGDGPTVPSNWKFFNIFVLSFFDFQGYEVNNNLLLEYLNKSLDDYRGEGWYNDNPAYDYYSMWAYQMYAVLWNDFYGYKNYPDLALKLERNFRDLEHNYPYLFAKDGRMVMWGRSISYRYAAATVFPLMGLVKDFDTNWGWMRMIASSTLMQFFTHPEFMQDGVPTLGFYGPFEPATQMYSCRGSVYWGGKVFLGLLIPENSPFWQEKENDGPWEDELKPGFVYNKFQAASKILITDYPSTGVSEIRAWCRADKKSDWQKFRSSENYNRLSYNSDFLWQADGKNGEVAMAYTFLNDTNSWEPIRLYTFKSYENGVYRRNAVMETNKEVSFQLADITLPNGILRVDRVTASDKSNLNLRLGHYALPDLGAGIKKYSKKVSGNKVKIIDNGKYQLALLTFQNWGNMEFVDTKGLNPEAEKSKVVNVATQIKAGKTKEIVTLMLWKKSGEKWNTTDLFPINKIKSQSGKVEIELKSGHNFSVAFE